MDWQLVTALPARAFPAQRCCSCLTTNPQVPRRCNRRKTSIETQKTHRFVHIAHFSKFVQKIPWTTQNQDHLKIRKDHCQTDKLSDHLAWPFAMGGPAGGVSHHASPLGPEAARSRVAPGRVSPEDLETVPTAELLSELKRRKPTQLDGIV